MRTYFSSFKTQWVEKQPTTVKVDFIGVEFVSRNAMHEIIKQIQLLSKLNSSFVFENMNETVQKMYQMVSKSLKYSENETFIISRYTISSIEEFNKILNA